MVESCRPFGDNGHVKICLRASLFLFSGDDFDIFEAATATREGIDEINKGHTS